MTYQNRRHSALCLSLSPNLSPFFYVPFLSLGGYKTRRGRAPDCCQSQNHNTILPLSPLSRTLYRPLSASSSPPSLMKFSIGCMSQSAIAVADPLGKKLPPQAAEPPSSSPTNTTQEKRRPSISEKGRRSISEKGKGAGVGDGGVNEEKAKEAAAELGIATTGVQRLMKGIKSLSQMFALYDNGEEEEEEEEREIVIGYPTDVQHVGHIGWDGMNKVGGLDMGMASAFSLPSSLSLHHLDIAMDAGAGAATTCTN